jgi:hypothetical protein
LVPAGSSFLAGSDESSGGDTIGGNVVVDEDDEARDLGGSEDKLAVEELSTSSSRHVLFDSNIIECN